MPTWNIELVIYAALFGVGLLTSVYVMLHGSIHMSHDPSEVTPPPAGFNTPVIGAALVSGGAVGYLVSRYSTLDHFIIAILALLGAAAGWTIITLLMAKWAFKGPIIDPHEELEELQGTVATVVREIRPDMLGEIHYPFRGKRLHVAARNIGGETIPAGIDVVIEKIENGIADVELWTLVEQRI